MRDVAHDAEDAIELFVLKVDDATRRRRGLQQGRSACFPSHVHHLNKVGKEVESISKRLQDIESGRLRYGLRDLGEGLESTSRWRSLEDVERRRRLYPWQTDKHLVGLNEDVKLLLEKAILDKKKKSLSIAAIVGMGGIGKLTLARKIYNGGGVAAVFVCRAWVVVSSEFTPEEVIKQIILQLHISNYDRDRLKDVEFMKDKLRREEMLREMLHKWLVGKRYFIVLEVWERTHRESLVISDFPDE